MRPFPTTHIVHYHSHHHPLSGLVNQSVCHQIAQGIVLEDIHIYMDMMRRFSDISEQLREERIAVSHDVNLIILEGQRERLIDKEIDQLFLSLWYAQILLLDKSQHRTFRELVNRALANQSLLAMVEPEEKVEHQAHYR